jgi:hypothetical protein
MASGIDGSEPPIAYDIAVSLSLAPPQVEGTVESRFLNTSSRELTEAVFFLFPDRFASPDTAVNDFNRPFVYPEQEFAPGRLDIMEARASGLPTTVSPLDYDGLSRGTAVRVAIPRLDPGGMATVTLRFRTVVPYRFGSFGLFEDQLTLIGGWHPYLAALDRDGTWRVDEPPQMARFTVKVATVPRLDVVLNGKELSSTPLVVPPYQGGTIGGSLDQVPGELYATVIAHYLSLVAAPQLLREEAETGTTRIVYYRRPERRSHRVAPGPALSEMMLGVVQQIVAVRPAPVPEPVGDLVVVQAPLRLDLTAQGEGAVVVSDRALAVHELLRPFHEVQIARAVYHELLRPLLTAKEPPRDYWWVNEGVSDLFARRYLARTQPDTRSVQDWIDRFNIFAIVDRFESVPRIPFVGAFFARSPSVDPLHERIATFNHDRPPGQVVLGKLRELVGSEDFDALAEPCLTTPIPFRRCIAGAVAGRNVDELLDLWLGPYPRINYRLESVDLNQREFDRYRHEIVVRRESSRPFTEPVTVRLRTVGERDVDLKWASDGELARMPAVTESRVRKVAIDPERKLIEERRDDNVWPPSPQLVLDTADVEVSSTEFGISGLVVGRNRNDYRKDLAAAGVYTNRGIGFTVGGRAHWGMPIDPTLYRHNAYLFYGLEFLDGSFRNKSRPDVHTDGRLGSFGLRYTYTNVFAFDNPADVRNLSVYADWYDRSLGSDFNYADWGVDVGLSQPLWGYRTIGAVEVLNGFSEPLGSGRVPNQGLYSLGGSRSIRGIGAEEELGRNIFLVRAEVRQSIYPEVDLNFLDLLVLRRTQAHLFVDTGRVDDSAGRIYDVGGFAVGVGAGLAAAYEFMGFFPSLAYLEVATRVGEGSKVGDVQVLFGTRQAF